MTLKEQILETAGAALGAWYLHSTNRARKLKKLQDYAERIGFDLDAYIQREIKEATGDLAQEYNGLRQELRDAEARVGQLLQDKKNLQTLAVHHHDRASALAGKLRAVRETLGRDLRDFGEITRLGSGGKAAAEEIRQHQKDADAWKDWVLSQPRWWTGKVADEKVRTPEAVENTWPVGTVRCGDMEMYWVDIAGAVIDLVKYHAKLPSLRTPDGYINPSQDFQWWLDKWAGNAREQ